jgi:hypothetical protein
MSRAKLPRIQLLSSRDCPNAEPTRHRLRAALASEGLPPVFEEVNLDEESTPAPLRKWGSPTVLVDGEDLAGGAGVSGAACRIYAGTSLAGVPPETLMRTAIQRAMVGRSFARIDLLRRQLGLWLWGLPAIAIVVGSFLGRLGHLAFWVPAFTIAGVACVVNARRCRRIHCHVTGPMFLLAAAATALVTAGLLHVQFGTVLSLTVVVLVASFVPEFVTRRKYFASQDSGTNATPVSKR